MSHELAPALLDELERQRARCERLEAALREIDGFRKLPSVAMTASDEELIDMWMEAAKRCWNRARAAIAEMETPDAEIERDFDRRIAQAVGNIIAGYRDGNNEQAATGMCDAIYAVRDALTLSPSLAPQAEAAISDERLAELSSWADEKWRSIQSSPGTLASTEIGEHRRDLAAALRELAAYRAARGDDRYQK